MTKRLTFEQIQKAADMLNVEIPVIQAVIDVESAGRGFIRCPSQTKVPQILKTEVPKILFEAHYFHRLTGGRYDISHPGISSRRWNRSLYRYGCGEWQRFMEARELDFEAAIQSASWGLFQIMGIHWQALGYESAQEFFLLMYMSEWEHLKAFVRFIEAKGLAKHLRAKNWHRFAYRYNGAGYLKNRYHTKLKKAYERHAADA